MNPTKTSKQLIAGFVAAAIAFFLPEVETGDVFLNALVSFCAFAPMVMILSSAINTRLLWEGMKAFTVTGFVSLFMGYLSYFADIGFLAGSQSLWWHPAITGLGMFATAVLGFNHAQLKKVLELIFDYTYKNKNV